MVSGELSKLVLAKDKWDAPDRISHVPMRFKLRRFSKENSV